MIVEFEINTKEGKIFRNEYRDDGTKSKHVLVPANVDFIKNLSNNETIQLAYILRAANDMCRISMCNHLRRKFLDESNKVINSLPEKEPFRFIESGS